MESRYLEPYIKQDLLIKMVFLGGPRQVGKTTFAQSLLVKDLTSDSYPGYLSWDSPSDKRIILSESLPSNQKLIVFDEIHKF